MNTLNPAGAEFGTSIADVDRADVRVDVRNLNFFYGKTRALKNVSLPFARN